MPSKTSVPTIVGTVVTNTADSRHALPVELLAITAAAAITMPESADRSSDNQPVHGTKNLTVKNRVKKS